MSAIDKLQEAARQGTVPSVPLGDTMQTRAPNLWELLTLTRLPNGRARRPSSIRIWLGKGDWSWALNDEDTHQSLYGRSGALAEVFGDIEAALTSEAPQWRIWSKERVNGQAGRK